MKQRLKKNFVIEDAHTTGDSGSTPGFGVATPGFGDSVGAKTASRMSPMDSVVSSGVASPMAGGQMSPWLLEAEALVNGEEDLLSFPTAMPSTVPSSNAWGFEPSKLFDVPEITEAPQIPHNKSEDFMNYEDELQMVGVFNTEGLLPDSPNGPDFENQLTGAPELVTDSMASTATSPAPFIQKSRSDDTQKSRSDSHKDKYSPRREKQSPRQEHTGMEAAAAFQWDAQGLPRLQEYAPGAKVSYWSSSKGEWLPAVIVEQKSSKVYVIDKQMKGCLAKVRASDLISAEEEKQDPVLRALASFKEPSSSSRSGTPRGGSGTPRGGSGTPRGSQWQPPGMAEPPSLNGTPRGRNGSGVKQSGRPGVAGGSSPRDVPAARKGSATGGAGTKTGSPTKAGKPQTIRAELPPALAGVAAPTSKSPRGRIVRDDFSDDSDDD
jgi:hypothetical protein